MTAENDWRRQVERIELHEGDLVVLRVEEHLSREALEQIAEQWSASFGEHRLLVLEGGMELTVLSDEDLARLGLRRAPNDE